LIPKASSTPAASTRNYEKAQLMDTRLADFIRDTRAGKEAAEILRSCVHCGFCTATCPTYQLLGDELDGPRGRIYLIKQVLEGKPVTEKTRLHLDRCLTCRACETTCPSGVKYTRLLDIGRQVVEEKLPRRAGAAFTRKLLSEVLPRPGIFGPAVKLGQVLRPLLPSALADRLPALSQSEAKPWPAKAMHERRMLATRRLRAASACPEYQCGHRPCVSTNSVSRFLRRPRPAVAVPFASI
jgi:glycolate oxidase iron-sulfur subunit